MQGCNAGSQLPWPVSYYQERSCLKSSEDVLPITKISTLPLKSPSTIEIINKVRQVNVKDTKKQYRRNDTMEHLLAANPECTHCSKMPPKGGPPHKCCSRCKQSMYCGRECQQADWKRHKQYCTMLANVKAALLTPDVLGTYNDNKSEVEDHFGLNPKTILHGRFHDHAFSLLADAYRLRVRDEHEGRGTVSMESIYNGNPSTGFREFLSKAEKRPGILPPGWSDDMRNACLTEGDDRAQWSCVHVAVDMRGIGLRYQALLNNGFLMPSALRALAAEILGSKVIG